MRDEDLIEYERVAYETRRKAVKKKSWHKIAYILAILAWLAFVLYLTFVPEATNHYREEHREAKEVLEDIRLNNILAVSDVNKAAEEAVTYEDWFRANASVIEDCKITHYCCEIREHICGTGTGITATGAPVTSGWTCAVDPTVISFGSDVMVDYGDSVAFYKAQDRGGAIKGNHIDLAVETHSEALEAGKKTATVYWLGGTYGTD